jgi:flagellar biosynthesis GTPase FlhF
MQPNTHIAPDQDTPAPGDLTAATYIVTGAVNERVRAPARRQDGARDAVKESREAMIQRDAPEPTHDESALFEPCPECELVYGRTLARLRHRDEGQLEARLSFLDAVDLRAVIVAIVGELEVAEREEAAREAEEAEREAAEAERQAEEAKREAAEDEREAEETKREAEEAAREAEEAAGETGPFGQFDEPRGREAGPNDLSGYEDDSDSDDWSDISFGELVEPPMPDLDEVDEATMRTVLTQLRQFNEEQFQASLRRLSELDEEEQSALLDAQLDALAERDDEEIAGFLEYIEKIIAGITRAGKRSEAFEWLKSQIEELLWDSEDEEDKAE